eukprot:1723646-Prymnesium_polylepis.2
MKVFVESAEALEGEGGGMLSPANERKQARQVHARTAHARARRGPPQSRASQSADAPACLLCASRICAGAAGCTGCHRYVLWWRQAALLRSDRRHLCSHRDGGGDRRDQGGFWHLPVLRLRLRGGCTGWSEEPLGNGGEDGRRRHVRWGDISVRAARRDGHAAMVIRLAPSPFVAGTASRCDLVCVCVNGLPGRGT